MFRQPQFHAEIHDILNLAIDHVAFQPELGHAQPHHAARHWLRLEHRDRISELAQILRRRQPAWPDPTIATRSPDLRSAARRVCAWSRVSPIGHEAFQAVNVERFIHLAAVAGVFAAVVADAAADRRERIVFLDDANTSAYRPSRISAI